MTGKIKLTLILTSVILVIIAVTTAGFSLALWTESGGVGGESGNSVSPSVTPVNEYVWAKYFQFEVETVTVGDKTTEYAVITKFYTDNAGVNLEDVVIPSQLTKDGKTYETYRISSQVFMDMTLKKLPVTIYIPSTVKHIDAFAFSNMPNLQKVVFLGGSEKGSCNIEDYAFAFCQNLIKVDSARTLVGSNNAFIECAPSIVKPTLTAPATT